MSISKCIELVEYAHHQHNIGNAVQPLRSAIVSNQARGILGTMPAYLGGENEVMGLKAVTVFPSNHKIGLESHQGAIILMNHQNGQLHAVIDAAEITALRTAAASALATKYLARKDSTSLALIGTGVQAHSHLKALNEVIPFEHIMVWNRTQEKAAEFVKTYENRFPVFMVEDIDDALKADVICTLTASREPLFDIDQVRSGCHINAVGASQPHSRELGSNFAKKASWFTDVRASAINEAGALLIPLERREIDELPEIIELGVLINQKHPGRQSPDEITVYKSLGVGIQDLVYAQYVLSQAETKDMGVVMDL